MCKKLLCEALVPNKFGIIIIRIVSLIFFVQYIIHVMYVILISVLYYYWKILHITRFRGIIPASEIHMLIIFVASMKTY